MHKPARPGTVTDRSVRDRLIDVGERLIGKHGLDGVSLRQISATAGTRNNYAVQYHFGDADGLIRAIIAQRTPEIESRRAEALRKMLDAQGPSAGSAPGSTLSTRAITDVFFRSLVELVDGDGNPRLARFMLALHVAPDGWQPLDDMFFMMPVTEQLLDLFKLANPDIPAPVIWQRLRPISVMVLTYACNPLVYGGPGEYREAVLDGLFDMAAAALSVPVRQSAAAKIYGMIF
jgi:AcrR family transcriptional regulator